MKTLSISSLHASYNWVNISSWKWLLTPFVLYLWFKIARKKRRRRKKNHSFQVSFHSWLPPWHNNTTSASTFVFAIICITSASSFVIDTHISGRIYGRNYDSSYDFSPLRQWTSDQWLSVTLTFIHIIQITKVKLKWKWKKEREKYFFIFPFLRLFTVSQSKVIFKC